MHSESWRFALRRFDGEGDGGKPDDKPEPKPDDKADDKPDEKPKSFTQEDLDRVVNDRLRREREKFADYGDLKKKGAEFDKLQDAQKTELEREKERAARAEADRDAALERSKTTARRAAIVGQAAKAGAIEPSEVVQLLPDELVSFDDDGNVSVDEAGFAAWVKARPHLFGKHLPQGDGDGGPRGGEGGVKDFMKASKEEFETELAKFGRRPRV